MTKTELELIKNIQNEVTNLELKTNVIDKNEYTRRVRAIQGFLKALKKGDVDESE